jgi:hypothetical protein
MGNLCSTVASSAESLPVLSPSISAAVDALLIALQDDPSEMALQSVLITIQQRLPAVLAAGVKQRRVAAIRNQALIVDTLAMTLSFIPVRERLLVVRVSRIWKAALQQPSLWRGCGWPFPRDVAAHPFHCQSGCSSLWDCLTSI